MSGANLEGELVAREGDNSSEGEVLTLGDTMDILSPGSSRGKDM